MYAVVQWPRLWTAAQPFASRGREDHLPGYHQGPGSPRPQCWSALPPLLEGEDQLHHAGGLYLRKAKEMGAAGHGPCVSSLFLGCAMLCCVVLSCTVLCCKFP